MQSAKKIAVASLLMLLLGSSAALAQAYEPNGDYYAPDGGHVVCGGTVNLAHIVNWTIDPATGMRITREQYQARYPWTNWANWTYDCASGLWTNNTGQQPSAPLYQGPAYYQAPAYYQSRGGRWESRNGGDHRQAQNDSHDHGRGDQHADAGHRDSGHGKRG